jgi:hypothetical protein
MCGFCMGLVKLGAGMMGRKGFNKREGLSLYQKQDRLYYT